MPLPQMDANNLAVCLAPSLFALSHQMPKPPSNLGRVGSFRRTAVNGHHSNRLNSPAALANNRMVNESVVSQRVPVLDYPSHQQLSCTYC